MVRRAYAAFSGYFTLDTSLAGDEETLAILETLKRGDNDDDSLPDWTCVNEQREHEVKTYSKCRWVLGGNTKDRLVWDESAICSKKDVYSAFTWLQYLVIDVLQPRGYTVNGCVAIYARTGVGQSYYYLVVNNVPSIPADECDEEIEVELKEKLGVCCCRGCNRRAER